MGLRELFNKYKSDKSAKHGYDKVYGPAMEPFRNENINLLEVGVFNGASMEAWVEYFPNATIYGIDIFVRNQAENIPILKHERVKWLKADSLKSDLPDLIKSAWGDVKFDFVIDDGLHTPKANRLTFSNIKHFMKDSGIYFVEDAWPLDIMNDSELNHPWVKGQQDKYNTFEMIQFINSLDGYKVRRHDLRKQSGNPDSYVFEVKSY